MLIASPVRFARPSRPFRRLGCAWLLAAPLVVQAAGEAPDGPLQAPWARWQGRVSLGASPSGLRLDSPAAEALSTRPRISAMGDYYFGEALVGVRDVGGFRATSGLAIGPRGQIFNGLMPSTSGGVFNVDRPLFGPRPAAGNPLDASNETATLSYVGIGYTGLTNRGGWSFSADLGLVSLSPGSAVKLGRVFGGGQGVDDLARDLRLAPTLQFGASYRF